MIRALAAVFVFGLLADVVPHCGGPEVVIQSPGEACGAHGPRWRGDCRAPADCYSTEDHGRVCTTACEQDGECAALGPGFTCSSHGVLDLQPEPRTRRTLCGRVTTAP